MKIMRKEVIVLVILMVLVLASTITIILSINGNSVDEPQKNNYPALLIPAKDLEKGNGMITNVWLDKSKLSSFEEYNIKYLFVDVGAIDSEGNMQDNEDAKEFIKMIQDYENENDYDFIVLPYTEVIIGEYEFDSEFKENLIISYENLAAAGYDGAFVDVEKIPFDQRASFLIFLEELNSKMGSKTVAIYAGAIDENPNEWEWEGEFFEAVSNRVDLIAATSYDLEIVWESAYKEELRKQFEFLSSKNWNANLILTVPTHNSPPETIENVLQVYEPYKENFIGVSIFVEWTSDEEDWKLTNQM